MSEGARESLPEPHVAPAGAMTRLSARYADVFLLRAAIQTIPVLGGPLDTIFAGLGARWQYERLNKFIAALEQRLRSVEAYESLPEVEPSEPLYDFVTQVFDHVIRNRSDLKREAFSRIVARQVIERQPWDDAEAAARLLAGISELHVQILHHALTAGPIAASPFNGTPGVVLSQGTRGPSAPRLPDLFTGIPERALRLACAELVAHGLFEDAGVGKLSTPAMEYFALTDLGSWFLAWIESDPRGERAG